jgi:predicted membrane protein
MDVGGRVNGIAITVVGAALLFNTLGLVDIEFWDFFWPLVIIAAGASLMTQTFRDRPGADLNETVSLFSVWSGCKRVSSSARFRGGDMTAIMGGCHLDLRQATIADGEVAVLNLLSVMGGHEIRVPENWNVVTRVFPLMGGVSDKTTPMKGRTQTLVLRGLAVMGGVEIRN